MPLMVTIMPWVFINMCWIRQCGFDLHKSLRIQGGSNSGPFNPKSTALPSELTRHTCFLWPWEFLIFFDSFCFLFYLFSLVSISWFSPFLLSVFPESHSCLLSIAMGTDSFDKKRGKIRRLARNSCKVKTLLKMNERSNTERRFSLLSFPLFLYSSDFLFVGFFLSSFFLVVSLSVSFSACLLGILTRELVLCTLFACLNNVFFYFHIFFSSKTVKRRKSTKIRVKIKVLKMVTSI